MCRSRMIRAGELRTMVDVVDVVNVVNMVDMVYLNWFVHPTHII